MPSSAWAAYRVLVEGLVDLGPAGWEKVDGLIEQGAYRHLYMHRTGPLAGLDVHDVAPIASGEQIAAAEPGMCSRWSQVCMSVIGFHRKANQASIPLGKASASSIIRRRCGRDSGRAMRCCRAPPRSSRWRRWKR